MNAFKISLMIALAAASMAVCSPADAPPPPAVASDIAALAQRIRQLEKRLERLERPHGEDLIVPGMRAVGGVWRIEDTEIISPDDPVALLQFPQHPPDEYVLSLRVRRISGYNTFAIGVPVGGRQVLVALDAHLSTVSGLEYLDGKFVHENEATFRGNVFVSDKSADIAVTVRKDRITCAVDDVTVIDWRGDAGRLSLPETFAVPDGKAIFLATLGSTYAVSDMRLWPLASPVARLDAPSAETAECLARFKERWNLQLMPANLPQIGPWLTGTVWDQRGPQNILGRGTDQFIRFQAPGDQGAEPAIVFTTVQHHGANAQNRTTETTKTFPLVTAGPFLEYDGLIHTAFVTADRKRFIPHAVLRVADRTWYCAGSRRLPDNDGAPGRVEVAEYLFEFEDDPVRHDTGRLTLQQHIRTSDGPAGEVTRAATNFALFQHDGDDSVPYEVQVARPGGGRSLTIFFYAGQNFALADGVGPPVTRIFMAAKE
ncbi:MAG TPA: hypothetical protein VGH74_18655 [Planctomycetaceae bacterium]|jgi:hypothetical protein